MAVVFYPTALARNNSDTSAHCENDMCNTHPALVVAWLLTSVVGIAQEPSDSRRATESPKVTVSYDNWWFGTRTFSFNSDGSFAFEFHCKPYDSRLKGTGKLPPERIEQFISSLHDKQFFGVSEESIERKIAQEGGRQSRRTDQTTYQIAVQGAKLSNSIKYYDVYGDAEKFPNIADLQHLKDSVDEVKRFLSGATSVR